MRINTESIATPPILPILQYWFSVQGRSANSHIKLLERQVRSVLGYVQIRIFCLWLPRGYVVDWMCWLYTVRAWQSKTLTVMWAAGSQFVEEDDLLGLLSKFIHISLRFWSEWHFNLKDVSCLHRIVCGMNNLVCYLIMARWMDLWESSIVLLSTPIIRASYYSHYIIMACNSPTFLSYFQCCKCFWGSFGNFAKSCFSYFSLS